MPKDWRSYRAETERLYAKEKRPLEEARHVFREKCGSSASMRAYQMRIDDWGLKTDQTYRASHHSRSWSSGVISAGKISPRLTSSAGTGRTGGGLSTSPEIDEAEQLSRLKQGPFEVLSAFELLQSRWHPGPESTLLCFQHPDYQKWSKRSNPDHGPILFKLIEALVPPNEQLELNKSFLKTDLTHHSDPNYPYNAWRYAWRTVLRCENLIGQPDDDEDGEISYCTEDWDHAKETLREYEVISQVAGETFLDSALVVVAERRLTACSENQHRWNRRKYLNMLKDFRYMNVDVDPSFYKNSLRIIELEKEESCEESKQKWSDLADEFRQKYLRLINCGVQIERGISKPTLLYHNDSGGAADPATAHYPSPSTTNHERNSEPPDPLSPEPALPSTPIPIPGVGAGTLTVFNTLVAKWKTLDSFTEYAHSLLAADGSSISLFLPAPSCCNIFMQISALLPATEQFALTSALLLAISSLPPTVSSPSAWFLHWWRSVSSSPSWPVFLARLDIPRTTAHLETLMGPLAAKLFLDAAVLLVGEVLMLQIKDLLGKARKTRDESEEARKRCKSWEGDYMDILRELYAREVRVDQTWTVYLMNVIC
ncbi:unnamed protein product [Diplocarpon coronariae]